MKTLVRVNPSPFGDLFEAMNSLFDSPSTPAVSNSTWSPAANVSEDKKAYHVELELPGFDKEQLNIEVSDKNQLVISAEMNNENTNENDEGKVLRREFSYRSFRRAFQLPDDVTDSGKIKAKYKNGLLKVDLPKSKKANPVKMINIQ